MTKEKVVTSTRDADAALLVDKWFEEKLHNTVLTQTDEGAKLLLSAKEDLKDKVIKFINQ